MVNFFIWFLSIYGNNGMILSFHLLILFQSVNSTIIHAWILPNLFLGLYSWSIWGVWVWNISLFLFSPEGEQRGFLGNINHCFYFLIVSLSSWCKFYKAHMKHFGKCVYCFYYVKELVQDHCYFFLIIWKVHDFRYQGLEFIGKSIFQYRHSFFMRYRRIEIS